MSATLEKSLLGFFPNACSFFVRVKRYHVAEVCINEVETLEVSSLCPRSISGKLHQLIERLPFKTGGIAKPGIDSKMYQVVACCIVAFGRVGTSILVFLPGMLEIVTLYDSLHDMLQDQGITRVDIFVLHSQLPLEEQAIAFVAPSLDRVHVILSTNLSESSVTIPSLALVINTALQQYSHFDSTQQMSVLRKTWTSKAACTQRAGRAGREFPGVVIHTIPRTLYNLLPDFNTPEMSTAPLDRLYLSARSIGPHFGIHSPSRFLQLAPSPHIQAKLEDTVQYLAERGAIVSLPGKKPSERAELTLLGELALGLPLDTRLVRLVLIGCCIGIVYEAVIISAYVTLDCDCFITPTPFSTKSAEKYAEIVAQSINSRYSGDEGQLADTWLVCRMFDAWLKFRQNHSGSKSRCSREFGALWGVYPYRLIQLESQVSMIAKSLRSLTTGDIKSSLCYLHAVHEPAVKIKSLSILMY